MADSFQHYKRIICTRCSLIKAHDQLRTERLSFQEGSYCFSPSHNEETDSRRVIQIRGIVDLTGIHYSMTSYTQGPKQRILSFENWRESRENLQIPEITLFIPRYCNLAETVLGCKALHSKQKAHWESSLQLVFPHGLHQSHCNVRHSRQSHVSPLKQLQRHKLYHPLTPNIRTPINAGLGMQEICQNSCRIIKLSQHRAVTHQAVITELTPTTLGAGESALWCGPACRGHTSPPGTPTRLHSRHPSPGSPAAREHIRHQSRLGSAGAVL